MSGQGNWTAWEEWLKGKASNVHKAIETDHDYVNVVEITEVYITSALKPLKKKKNISGLPKPLNHQTKFIKKGKNLWGLKDTTWNLSVVASDYYILLLANIFDPEKYTPYLEHRSNTIVDQFTRYTDMAVGGELRHAHKIGAKDSIPLPLMEALYDDTLNGSRNSAWEGWYHFRHRYGILALVWAVGTFGLKGWGGGYGGKRWMNIANTLLMYEQGLTTKHTFIDTCFGLQHNGGIYFNKWWSTSGIKKVLDSNQRGDYCGIYKNTTQMVKNIVNKDISAMLKEACLCSNCGTN